MYGLVALKNGKLDLTKSSGPFSLTSFDKFELTLQANTHSIKFKSDMPRVVTIRNPPPGVDVAQHFQKDEWVNLVSSSSLLKKSTKEQLTSSGIKFWERSLDKVFSLYPSKRFLAKGGAEVVKYIASNIKTNDFAEDLTGLQKADQFFPRGYELWSAAVPTVISPVKLEGLQTVEVIVPETGYANILKSSLLHALSSIKGIKANVSTVKLSDLNERMKKGDYDLLGTGLAVADPNFEGAMSFFFERSPAFVTSTQAPFDFDIQVKLARELPTSKDRANAMRAIVIKAQEAGHMLPLFHFSSMAMAKDGVDLSQIPNSDETVLFWKVRMK